MVILKSGIQGPRPRPFSSEILVQVSLYEEQCKWCTNERKAIEKEAKTKYAYNEKKLISNGSIDISLMYQPYRFWVFDRNLEKYERSLEQRAIVIGLVVFITAVVAQVWIWDIFGHFKIVRSLSDRSSPAQSSNDSRRTNLTSNCTKLNECKCNKSQIDMSFLTGELARKHVEVDFKN